MCPDDPKTCRRIQTAIKLFIRPNAPKIDSNLFIHSLPSPIPKDKPEIIDIVLQLILLLIEQFKPDNGDNGDNGDTNFPNLARTAADLARQHVDGTTLFATASMFSQTIALTVHNLTLNPPPSLRLGRETIRRANHAALGPDVHSWATWNDAIRQVLDRFAQADYLNTVPSYLDAWTQISKGLQQIK